MKGDLHDPDARAALLARLEALRPASERRWGRMSAHQAVCHLADSFEWAAGRRTVSAVKGPPVPRAVMRLVALRLPLRWPKGVPTLPEADQMKAGTPPVEFDADRTRLVELIHEFGSWPDARARPPHPFFGPMSRAEWGRWAYRHLDHHLRQFGR